MKSWLRIHSKVFRFNNVNIYFSGHGYAGVRLARGPDGPAQPRGQGSLRAVRPPPMTGREPPAQPMTGEQQPASTTSSDGRGSVGIVNVRFLKFDNSFVVISFIVELIMECRAAVFDNMYVTNSTRMLVIFFLLLMSWSNRRKNKLITVIYTFIFQGRKMCSDREKILLRNNKFMNNNNNNYNDNIMITKNNIFFLYSYSGVEVLVNCTKPQTCLRCLIHIEQCCFKYCGSSKLNLEKS